MQHRRRGRILKREKGQREALIRSLMRSIVMKSAVVTTEAKAKEVRRHLERLVTKEIRGTLAGHRSTAAAIGKDAAARLKKEVVPKIGERKGGYLRIVKYGVRISDGSRMARIGFVD